MALPLSGVLGIVSGTGVTSDRSIALEVDGNEVGSKSLSALAATAGIALPASMTDFYGYSASPPGPPENVQAVDQGAGIDVGWSQPLTGGTVDYYVVERNQDTSGWTFLEQTTAFSVQDLTTISGSLYVYRVYAHNSAGDSAAVESNSILKS